MTSRDEDIGCGANVEVGCDSWKSRRRIKTECLGVAVGAVATLVALVACPDLVDQVGPSDFCHRRRERQVGRLASAESWAFFCWTCRFVKTQARASVKGCSCSSHAGAHQDLIGARCIQKIHPRSITEIDPRARLRPTLFRERHTNCSTIIRPLLGEKDGHRFPVREPEHFRRTDPARFLTMILGTINVSQVSIHISWN